MIKLSVLIPIFGVAAYIEKFADSLLNQSMKDGIEFIFVNDFSCDNSIEILQNTLNKYPERIPQVRIINHSKNQGIARTRQTALSEAKGLYVVFCDSDDWMESDYCMSLVNMIEDSKADCVICDYYEEIRGNIKPYDHNFERINSAELLSRISGRNNKIWGVLWNKIFRRDILQDVEFTRGINVCEDVLMMFKIFSKERLIVHLPKRLYYYRKVRIGSEKQQISETALSKDLILFKEIEMLAEKKADCEYYLSCISFIQEQIISRAFRFSVLSDNEFKKTYKRYFSQGHINKTFPIPLYLLALISVNGWHRMALKIYNNLIRFIK